MFRNQTTATTIRRSRISQIGLLIVGAGIVLFAGCDVRVLYPGDWEGTPVEDESLLVVTAPGTGSTYVPTDTIHITWSGQIDSDSVSIDLYRYGQIVSQLSPLTSNTGSFDWTIPVDFDASVEIIDDYQVAIRARHNDHSPGELYVQALSEPFTIVPGQSAQLTDVTVGQRIVTITVIDNGLEIDGDTIDIVLNGNPVVLGHVLAAPPGTDFELILQAGENELEIVAVNEGSVSPNTAQLLISNVTEGEADQEWRLSSGERGSLIITAP